jgi:adenine-specific DNA-methyltransferase
MSREGIRQAITCFAEGEFNRASFDFWETLGYSSYKSLELPTEPNDFWDSLPNAAALSRKNAHVDQWKSAHFLFQLSNDEIPSLGYGQLSLIAPDVTYQKGMIESFVLLAIELTDQLWTRTELAKITRELNRAFPMPAIMLFKHGASLSIAVIDRRVNKRDASKDVIDQRRIAIIKDILIESPHRAHLEILNDLSLINVGEKHRPSNFRDLYESWMRVLSVKELNQRFYDELFTWYCWALRHSRFPQGQKPDVNGQSPVGVIRLLTRLIFVWFVKEKGVVPDELFRPSVLDDLLKESPTKFPDSSSYYQAILQNLFFATLNTEPRERAWKSEGSGGMTSHYLVHSVYRYRTKFKNANLAFEYFRRVPFLNGGLFECLDRQLSDRDIERSPDLKELAEKEGKSEVLRADGFSDRPNNALSVPNKLFFSEGEEIDLNEELHTKGKKKTARGLIEIFARYKFTVEENTPVEEEVALDPELLGKVFENLLASFNEDTQSTARKQSGSFYTPREVVDYMVDESLIAYFNGKLEVTSDGESNEARLRALLAYGTNAHQFDEAEIDKLISAIENVKVLDPACGSGAFPMGMLQKLVHVLSNLDENNTYWKVQNRQPLERQLKEAESIPDPTLRETKVQEAQDALEKLDKAFSDKHYADYSRKLYLVEKCLFGVDIQPIAVQIAKLRFFISLVVSQKVNPHDEANNFNITPLPNLETKLAAANSLIPIEHPDQIRLRDTRIDLKEDELRLANERHFAARSTKTKRKWRDKITDLRDDLAILLQEGAELTPESAKQVVTWDPFDQNASAEFFDPEWMFGLQRGFDVVLGNPPYVRHEGIKEQKEAFSKIYDCYTGTADLYVYFYERSVRLLKLGGVLAFITSNKWYRANYGTKLREWMNGNTLLKRIIDFGDEPIFTALAYPTIVIAIRRAVAVKAPHSSNNALILNWINGMDSNAFADMFEHNAFTVPQTSLGGAGWQLENASARQLLERVRRGGEPLTDWCGRQLYAGIKTGLNEGFIIPDEKRQEFLSIDKKCAEIILPVLRGRDVKRWRVADSGHWLVKIESSENVAHKWSGLAVNDAWNVFAKEYPAIAHYFGSEPMKSSLQRRVDKGRYFWELRSCAFWNAFGEPKVFMPSIENSVKFAPVLGEMYGNNKTHFVVTRRWAYLSAILNSTISWWFTQQVFTAKQGGYFEFIPQFVGQIPIPEVNERHESLFVGMVRAIVAGVRVSQFELLLNGLIYELFFPEDLQKVGIGLLEAVYTERVGELSELSGESLASGAEAVISRIFRIDHPIYRMLFDLQALEVVRIIEGKN